MINPHQLELLHAVAACESYSRAAERLGISQPAVSMQLKKLEEAMGVPLAVTRGRQVQLTEAGQVLAGFAARILRLNDEALQAMSDFRELRRGRLRIAASSTPGAYLLPATVAAFRQVCPDVAVSLEVSNTRSALRLVAEGLADFAVVGDVAPDGPEVELQPLCADHLGVVVAPSHPWGAVGAITAAQLAAEPLILREEGSSTRQVLAQRLSLLGLEPAVGLELGSTEAVKEAVASGLGPAVLSGWAVRWDVNTGRMVPVTVTDLDLRRTLHLATPGGRELDTLGQRFVAELRAHCPCTSPA
jgi:LysR family transcriptional regulator, low CO2-responsive transcriptional regulator